MDKHNKELYLSELFLKNLHGDYSRNSVLRALAKCNDEALQRMGVYNYINEVKQQKILGQEFADFRDVYGEFEEMLSPETRRNYLILQMI